MSLHAWDECLHTFRARMSFSIQFWELRVGHRVNRTGRAETHDKERTVTKALTLGVALLGLTALSQSADAHSCNCQHAAYHSHRHAYHHRYTSGYRPYYRTSYRTTYGPYYEPYWNESYYYRPRPYWSEPRYSIGLSYGPFWRGGGFHGRDWDDDDD
jgi:hypothetical protein